MITWAPRRVTSAIMPTSRWASAQTVDSMAYWYWPSTMESQSHTKLLAQLSYSQDVRAIDEV